MFLPQVKWLEVNRATGSPRTPAISLVVVLLVCVSPSSFITFCCYSEKQPVQLFGDYEPPA